MTYQDNKCGLFIPLRVQVTSTLGRKSECVCVCGSGKIYVMRTKGPNKDSYTNYIWPCGDIFWSPWGKELIIQNDVFWKCKTAVFCDEYV